MWHQWFNRNVMKLQEYFLCAKKIKITTLFNDFFSSVSDNTRSQQYHDACVHSSACKQGAAHPGSTSECLWSTSTFVNMSVLLLSMQGQKALGIHQKYLNLCSEDEQRSYRFGTTWGWVINDSIFIFGWTIPLNKLISSEVVPVDFALFGSDADSWLVGSRGQDWVGND